MWVELADAGIGAQPKIAVLIRQRRINRIVAEAAVVFGINCESFGFRIEPIQPAAIRT